MGRIKAIFVFLPSLLSWTKNTVSAENRFVFFPTNLLISDWKVLTDWIHFRIQSALLGILLYVKNILTTIREEGPDSSGLVAFGLNLYIYLPSHDKIRNHYRTVRITDIAIAGNDG